MGNKFKNSFKELNNRKLRTYGLDISKKIYIVLKREKPRHKSRL